MIRGIKIPMRDGIHLNATFYVPVDHPVPSPTVFMMTPYVTQYHHDRGVYFSSNGLPFLIVDVRGRGASGGTFKPISDVAEDGTDVTAWLTRQPYCNGKIAMYGGSYSGYAQWAVAKMPTAGLSAIVPVASPFRGVDSPMRNNIFPSYVVRWLTLISGSTSQERIFADTAFWSAQFRRWYESGKSFSELDVSVGEEFPSFREWLSHPEADAYWDSFNPTPPEYAHITIPVLTITGMCDADQPGALAHHALHIQNASQEARSRHYLVIGPWDHAGTASPKLEFCGITAAGNSLVDLLKLHLEWYRWTLQGGAKPEFLKKQVAYYVLGADEWRYADSVTAITSHYLDLFPQSVVNPIDLFHSGLLADSPLASSYPDQYVYDPADISMADLESTIDPENRSDQRLLSAASGRALFYHGRPFDRAVDVCGFFRFSVWLEIDQPDTDFRVGVYDVGLDGRAILLTSDWLRARYRESFRVQKLITAKAPLRYEFERFPFVSYRVNKGHRLRLVIGPINSIYFEKNHNSGGVVARESLGDSRPVTVKLHHDASHPSVLHVPIGASNGV
jgi:putative CocE/NonD family hydrolase